MKSFVKKNCILLLLAGAIGGLAACGGEESPASSSAESEANEQDFVAVKASEWDTAVTVGSHSYTFDLALKQDKTLLFQATCTGEVQQGGGGGPGGGGFPFLEGDGETSDGSTVSSSATADYSSFDFSFGGSWELETGYGYILSFEDDAKSTIHVDYIATQGRHQFYYSVTTSEGSAVTLFQARDSSFRSTLASDYATWDERNSTYIFTGETTGNNNSLAFAYLYCHKDGTLVYNGVSGADRKVTLGLSWALNGETFTIAEGQATYTAANSINSEHQGWRIAYDDITFYCSTSSGVDWDEMTNGDFDGKTLYQFTGSYTTTGPDAKKTDVELNLAEGGKAFLYSGTTLSSTGTYTFKNEVFTITLGSDEAKTVEKVDGVYTFSYQVVTQSFFGTSTIDVTLTYTPEA